MIIYQHIYKNGGTSIRNGFMHCNEHRMLLEKGPNVFIVDQNQFKELKISIMLNQLILQPMYINLKINKLTKNKNTRSVYHVSSRKNKFGNYTN